MPDYKYDKYDKNESGEVKELPLNIFVYDCKRCEMGGITDVIEFNDRDIFLSCKYGEITVEGEGLKIKNFNGTTGELSVEGDIKGVFRLDKPQKKEQKKEKKKNSVFG